MDQLPAGPEPKLGVRDLRAFNRWLCVTRLRASIVVFAFTVLVGWLHPGLIALAPAGMICTMLLLVSAAGLASRRATATMAFLVVQTFADLAAVTAGLGIATGGLPALFLRPLFVIVIVPPSLVSVPVGLAVATAATVAHLGLLLAEHGGVGTWLLSLECIAPPFLFFLIAQQCFFYGAHLEQKNAALAGLAEEVRAASMLKEEFVGAVSHELRSPLNVILGYLEMALDGVFGPLTPGLQAALRRTQGESLALFEMITTLLDLNRFESGRVPVERAPVDVGALLAELADEIPEAWRRTDVTLRVHASEDLPRIESDRGKMKTVLRNLVHNALKFTDHGEVRIAAAPTPSGDLALTVEDTGRGIPEDALGFIFDMFRQVPGSGGGGVGLGLHIVRRLVDALGGTVTVRSRVGIGTCFTIVLPAHVVHRTKTPGGVLRRKHGTPTVLAQHADR